jgi:hypothetical protein
LLRETTLPPGVHYYPKFLTDHSIKHAKKNLLTKLVSKFTNHKYNENTVETSEDPLAPHKENKTGWTPGSSLSVLTLEGSRSCVFGKTAKDDMCTIKLAPGSLLIVNSEARTQLFRAEYTNGPSVGRRSIVFRQKDGVEKKSKKKKKKRKRKARKPNNPKRARHV